MPPKGSNLELAEARSALPVAARHLSTPVATCSLERLALVPRQSATLAGRVTPPIFSVSQDTEPRRDYRPSLLPRRSQLCSLSGLPGG
jgi:hypothetical protein